MVECGLPKAETRVRFPSPAPILTLTNRINGFVSFGFFKNTQLLTVAANIASHFKDVRGCLQYTCMPTRKGHTQVLLRNQTRNQLCNH